ncbi:unnamed protein product [Anisakis simplex]|uniref:FLYWCH-type domain-containing protein n=1 Tax=Anisakis simplex TaxID=6269 RepID=A0A0M3JFB2_ANISI|nr:unnamed protein product [Anisakis simplex]
MSLAVIHYSYNHSIEFPSAEAAQRYVQTNGYRKVYERERRRKGGFKQYYLCNSFWDQNVKCSHKFTLIIANGQIMGKTTDGGRPHDHR